jgi:hypothetical protein
MVVTVRILFLIQKEEQLDIRTLRLSRNLVKRTAVIVEVA